MLKSTPKKTGRPQAIHKDRHGNQIVGLMRLKDGRWRASGPEKYTFTERDEDRAIAHFLHWQEQKAAPELGQIRIYNDPSAAAKEVAKRLPKSRAATLTVSRDGRAQVVSDPSLRPEQWVWLAEQLVKRPQWCAQMAGVEQLGWLPDLKKPGPSPTLDEVGKLYLEHAKLSDNWRAKCKQFWREFTDAVEVTKLREITQEHIVEYGDMIHEAAQTPTYSRQRFGAIKAIINYPTKRGKWAEDCKRALAFCAVLVPPSKSATDPNSISPDDFRALLDKADDQMRAVLLLSLNCCFYAGEVAVVDWSELDLDKATLVTARNKTKVIRIATLWPETVEALRKLPRRAEHLFLTEAGTQADYLCVYRLFKIVRKAAGLDKLQFAQIRDGSYTAAVEAGVDLDTCRLLAGHATGISDHYVKRRPAMVAGACEAIRVAYRIGA